MEKVEDIAKYILSLDTDNTIFQNKLITLQGRNCYQGNVRLNKYLHIMQMVYIAMNNKKLFNDDMYAYDNGVIIDSVMNNYKYLYNNKNSYNIHDEKIKEYLLKMFNILKYAPLDELIKISHQDEEWQNKHLYYQKMNVNSQVKNYKDMSADFIELFKRRNWVY